MPAVLPPIPYDKPQTSFEWIDWYTKLINLVNSGAFPHNSLTGLQGGTSGEYYHLTQSDYTSVVDKDWELPIGFVITTDSATDPSSMMGYGTWTLLGSLTI